MAAALNRQVKSARQHLDMLASSPALQSPTGYLDQRRKSVEMLRNRLVSAQQRHIEIDKRRFVAAVSKLDALSPLKVLTRGYALVKSEDGSVVKSVRQIEAGQRVSVQVSDGRFCAEVREKEVTQ